MGAGVVGRGGAFFCTLFSPDFPPCPDGVVEGRGFAGCRKTLKCCHSERSEESRSAAQGKLREGSRSECFQGSAGFFLGRRGDLLRMTVPTVSSAACLGPPKSGLIVSRIARGRGLGGQLFHIVQNAAIPWLKPGPAHARVSDRMDFESTHSLTRGGK